MADRCTINVTFRKCDLRVLEGSIFEGKLRQNFDTVKKEGELIYCRKIDAPFAYSEELMLAAAEGCVFFGEHSAGTKYPAAVFHSDGEGFDEREVTHNGFHFVVVTESGKIEQEDLDELRAFLAGYNETVERMKQYLPAGYSSCETTPDYWDCDCNNFYIHPKSRDRCNVCGTMRDEQPDSRVDEVDKHMREL